MILGEKDCADSPFRRLTGREYRCPRAAEEGKTRLVCGVIGSGGQTAVNADVPIWEKYTLTIEEASKYFRIGENKLRKLAEENPTAGWVILNGNRIQIKRKQFEKIIDTLDAI